MQDQLTILCIFMTQLVIWIPNLTRIRCLFLDKLDHSASQLRERAIFWSLSTTFNTAASLQWKVLCSNFYPSTNKLPKNCVLIYWKLWVSSSDWCDSCKKQQRSSNRCFLFSDTSTLTAWDFSLQSLNWQCISQGFWQLIYLTIQFNAIHSTLEFCKARGKLKTVL